MLFRLLKELEVLEKDMRSLATHDHLTNLLTRRVFYEKANDLVVLSKRDNREMSFLVVDLDHFQWVRDPRRQLLLQPKVIGAAMEVTKWLKPLM